MKLTKKVINKVLCFAVLANICCYPANAINDIAVGDYRFVNNTKIIEHIKSCVNFSGPSFKSLWSLDRAKESSEHLAIATDHMLYTMQLSSTLKVDEIFISAPIIDSASGSKMVGEILLTVPYGHNESLQDVMNELCFTNDLPDRFTQIGKQHIQYFLNAPDAPTELPVEYKKIESVSDYEEKKDDLESTKMMESIKEQQALDTEFLCIKKVLFLNIMEAAE